MALWLPLHIHGMATLTVSELLPVLLLVIGGVFPPSKRVRVTVTLICLSPETTLQMVLPVTLTVPGTCIEM